MIAHGGRGGRGNARFATSVHQAPREHEAGREGEEHTYRLELKLLADVGLVGYPNVGKSTLISRISAARPKIADYPFTTLQPNLGVVAVGDAKNEVSFVVADIPGLIEGAHEGAGLGTQFLRHIERTRLLVHLVDVSDSSGRPDVVKDVEVILGELSSFGAHLEEKPMIMARRRSMPSTKTKLAALKRYCKKHKLKLYEISAVTGKGIEELKYAMAAEVQKFRERELSAVVGEAVVERGRPQKAGAPFLASFSRSGKFHRQDLESESRNREGLDFSRAAERRLFQMSSLTSLAFMPVLNETLIPRFVPPLFRIKDNDHRTENGCKNGYKNGYQNSQNSRFMSVSYKQLTATRSLDTTGHASMFFHRSPQQ